MPDPEVPLVPLFIASLSVVPALDIVPGAVVLSVPVWAMATVAISAAEAAPAIKRFRLIC